MSCVKVKIGIKAARHKTIKKLFYTTSNPRHQQVNSKGYYRYPVERQEKSSFKIAESRSQFEDHHVNHL